MSLTLSSRPRLLDAIRVASDISLGAYVLSGGGMLDALASAAARGARVRVILAAGDSVPPGDIARVNEDAANRLRAAGATVEFAGSQPGRCAALHAKMALVDGAAYLDDCNWTASAGDTILRDDRPADLAAVRDALEHDAGDAPSEDFATRKRDALASEAALLHGAAGDEVAIESESFGYDNAVYREMERLAAGGVHPRLLVSQRDLSGNRRERSALEKLAAAGVRVRVTTESNEKFALGSGAAWLGSANASADWIRPDQLDWGARTSDGAIVAHLRSNFERRWSRATVLA